MPKSKVRKKNDFTINPVSRTPVKVKAGPSSVWFVVLFVGLMLLGLLWLLVFQLGATGPERPDLAGLDGGSGPVELRDRLCLHDHRTVAHHAVALTSASARFEFKTASMRYPYRNLVVTQSHRCDSSPLWIAPVDNFKAPGEDGVLR